MWYGIARLYLSQTFAMDNQKKNEGVNKGSILQVAASDFYAPPPR